MATAWPRVWRVGELRLEVDVHRTGQVPRDVLLVPVGPPELPADVQQGHRTEQGLEF